MEHVLGVLTWDPQIRGSLILLTAIAILCGSTWLLLATNVGARLGFLLAVAGLTGWLTVLGMLWWLTPSATGPKGRDPHWKVRGAISGALGPTAPEPLDEPLSRWNELPEADPQRAEVITASDEWFAADPAAQAFGIQGSADYTVGKVFDIGGERKGPFGVLNFRPFNVFHEPHYAAVTLRPNIKQETKPGEAPPTPKIDRTREPITVLLVRDLGSKRLPGFSVVVGSGTLFLVSLYALHRRDKQAMIARGILPAKA